MEFVPVAVWLGVVLALAAAALPVVERVFKGFPDGGASFAPATALAAVTLATYWFGHLAFGRLVSVGVALIFVLVGFALWGWRAPDLSRVRLPLAVFLTAFAFLVVVRAYDPGIVAVGGEKFLDYGILNSLLRADHLPPEDMWFAGHPLRYYYGGLLASSILVHLTGVEPNVAYNLALATFYATLVTGAFGLARAVAHRNGRNGTLAGGLAVFLVGLAGNLATPLRLLLAPHADLAAKYAAFAFTGIRTSLPNAIDIAATEWSYWLGRYVIDGTLTITPFWAYLNGDLHAHIIASAFLPLSVALAYTIYRASGRRRLGLLACLAVLCGFLTTVNTWSLPTTVGLAALALAFGPHPSPIRFTSRVLDELARYAAAVAGALLVAAVAVLVASPFLFFHTPVNRGVGFLPPRSDLGPLLLVHGVSLAAFLLWIRRYDTDLTSTRLAFFLGVLSAASAAVLLELDYAIVALVAPFLLAGWWALRRRDADFSVLLLLAGAGLALAVEFAYARVYPFDPSVPRWNTVYKVSLQIWVLWGIGASIAAGGVLERALDRVRTRSAPVRRARAAAPALCLLVLLLSTAVFPAAALAQHNDNAIDDPTLDGTRYAESYHPADARAIDWLDANVDGTPVIVEKPGRTIYSWRNAVSVMTGIPTVAGWTHEKGYRGAEAWRTRARDVDYIYEADWESAAFLLDYYDVQYVYYGPNERDAYGPSHFDDRTGVRDVYQNERVTIYRVDADTACEAVRDDCPG